MSERPIALMEEPSPADRQRAVIVMLWTARDLLSDTERYAGNDSACPMGAAALVAAEQARHLMSSADALCPVFTQLTSALSISRLATEATERRIAIYLHMEALDPGSAETRHARGLWRRAAEEARTWAHKALDRALLAWPAWKTLGAP